MSFSFASRIGRRQYCRALHRFTGENAFSNPQYQHPTSVAAAFQSLNPSSSSRVRIKYTDLAEEQIVSKKKKAQRSPAAQNSLRRVAVEAAEKSTGRGREPRGTKTVTAICVAEEFAMDSVVRLLRAEGYPIHSHGTGFLDDQIVQTRSKDGEDVFVFPSGTVVSWALPEDVALKLATETLLSATVNSHLNQVEIEDMEYIEDPSREDSGLKAEVIVLGTKRTVSDEGLDGRIPTTLAQIAFSSGLARSTKLAVLEASLGKYLDSTRPIPSILSQGKKLPFNQEFILQKTGALLELRAHLNHYSEITDSLPDLFWNSRHELGLEGYYDQVGRALDVPVRIKSLNVKMDYAHEIVSVLRETLRQTHSTRLEWIIIVLIAVEVVFELKRQWKDFVKSSAGEPVEGMLEGFN